MIRWLGWGQPGAPAGKSCWVSDPGLAGTGGGTDDLHRTSTAELRLPRSPRGRGARQRCKGRLHYFPATGTAQPALAVPAVGWCSQLGREHCCAFVSSLLCTGKGLGHVPKYPSALWRVVGLETSKRSESLSVWGLPSTSVCSRNRML